MRLEQLEWAEKTIRLCRFTGSTLMDALHRAAFSATQCSVIQQLLDDGQFYVLLHLKQAEREAFLALEALTIQTEYLREELEKHLCSLQVLMEKVEAEEALRRDRAALLLTLPPPASGEEQGVSTWISGNNTEPGSQ
jgi:hypothetical protein